jgi:hypothetical protein
MSSHFGVLFDHVERIERSLMLHFIIIASWLDIKCRGASSNVAKRGNSIVDAFFRVRPA